MGEYLFCKQEVAGSTPAGSTKMRVWCLTISMPGFHPVGEGLNPSTRSISTKVKKMSRTYKKRKDYEYEPQQNTKDKYRKIRKEKEKKELYEEEEVQEE